MEINNDPSILHNKIESLNKSKDEEALKRACKEFESIFLSMMFKEMKKTIPEDGFLEKTAGIEIFEDMYIDELSNEIANKDEGLGIAEMIYQQFKNGYVSW